MRDGALYTSPRGARSLQAAVIEILFRDMRPAGTARRLSAKITAILYNDHQVLPRVR